MEERNENYSMADARAAAAARLAAMEESVPTAQNVPVQIPGNDTQNGLMGTPAQGVASQLTSSQSELQGELDANAGTPGDVRMGNEAPPTQEAENGTYAQSVQGDALAAQSQGVTPDVQGGYNPANENAQLKQLIGELRNQNAQMRTVIENMGNAQQKQAEVTEQSVVEAMTDAGATAIPKLDLDAMLYADDDTKTRMGEEFANAMMEFAVAKAKESIMSELNPVVDSYNRSRAEAEEAAARERLKSLEWWNGDDTQLGKISGMVARDTEFLGKLPKKDAYEVAALIDAGYRSLHETVPVTEQAKKVMANPELMKAIKVMEAQANLGKQAENVHPGFIPSQGMATSVANPVKKPSNLKEASAIARRMLGLQ